MSTHNEALDAVGTTRPFAGVHALAAAMICANGSSADELELARRILLRDPEHDALREAESVAGAFNRHMDAAIESCNESAQAATRVTRRAKLAQDLDRAGLVLMDRAELALLLDRGAPCRPALTSVYATAEHDGHDLGVELIGGSIVSSAAVPSSSGGILGLDYGSAEGAAFVTNSPSFDVEVHASSAGDYEDPAVND